MTTVQQQDLSPDKHGRTRQGQRLRLEGQQLVTLWLRPRTQRASHIPRSLRIATHVASRDHMSHLLCRSRRHRPRRKKRGKAPARMWEYKSGVSSSSRYRSGRDDVRMAACDMRRHSIVGSCHLLLCCLCVAIFFGRPVVRSGSVSCYSVQVSPPFFFLRKWCEMRMPFICYSVAFVFLSFLFFF